MSEKRRDKKGRILHNGEMQMHSYWLSGGAREIPHEAQKSTGRDENLAAPCREAHRDQTVAVRIGHVRVIRPDL